MEIRVTTDMDIEAAMISKYGIVHVYVKCIGFFFLQIFFTSSKCINMAFDSNLCSLLFESQSSLLKQPSYIGF